MRNGIQNQRSFTSMTSSKDNHRSAYQGQSNLEETSYESSSVVSVDSLVKTYGNENDGVTAVDGISFNISKGTAVGILGPNGAGKTTTIKCLLGLVIPTSGSIQIAGTNVSKSPKKVYRHVGATFEGARNIYWRLTVMENIEFFSTIAGQDPRKHKQRYKKLLDQFGILEKKDTVARELSRGQKQKAALVCTLARDAEFLFMDEPTLGLDVASSSELRSKLRMLVEERNKAVVLSSHDMDVVEEVCDRVLILHEGKIIADKLVEEILGFFETTGYEIDVSGEISMSVKRNLAAKYEAKSFSENGSATRFKVTVTGDEFYRLIDDLRDAQLSIGSINALEDDLEDTFLKILEKTATSSSMFVNNEEGNSEQTINNLRSNESDLQ